MPDGTMHRREKLALRAVFYRPVSSLLRAQGRVGEILTWASAWLSFFSRSDDIYIVSYPRSGTTLIQMILYQLLSDGNMQFGHISEKIPYLDRAVTLRPEFIDSISGRRIFKTHLGRSAMHWWPGKYIYVVRNGPDVLVSCYHFYCSHFGFKGTLEQFYDSFIQGKTVHGSWFEHVAAWSKSAGDPNILFLKYEDIVSAPERTILQISEFCGIPVSEPALLRTVERCSFRFMKQNEDKFDHITEIVWEKNMRAGEFIRRGTVGESLLCLTDQQLDKFAEVELKMIHQN